MVTSLAEGGAQAPGAPSLDTPLQNVWKVWVPICVGGRGVGGRGTKMCGR